MVRGVTTVLLLAGILLAGCAGWRKPDLKSQIGIMTYDQALLELGPPNQVADLEGGGKVAQWLQYSSRVYSTAGPAYGAWGPMWGGFASANVSSTPAVYLLLTFGPDLNLASVRQQYK